VALGNCLFQSASAHRCNEDTKENTESGGHRLGRLDPRFTYVRIETDGSAANDGPRADRTSAYRLRRTLRVERGSGQWRTVQKFER
jgi:hypothetical protein